MNKCIKIQFVFYGNPHHNVEIFTMVYIENKTMTCLRRIVILQVYFLYSKALVLNNLIQISSPIHLQ